MNESFDPVAAIDAYLDEESSDEQLQALGTWIEEHPEAAAELLADRAFLHSRLTQMLGDRGAAAMPAPSPAAAPRSARDFGRQAIEFFRRPTPLSLAVAALLMGVLLTAMCFVVPPSYWVNAMRDESDVTDETVAQITGVQDPAWVDRQLGTQVGASLIANHRLELQGGFVEVTFRSGVRTVIEGPAIFRVNSRDWGTLEFGKLVAHVPENAKGFAVHTREAVIVDLGTEFGVEVDETEGTLVTVFEGQVEMHAPHADAAASQAKRLGRSESVRIARDGRVFAEEFAAAEFRRALPQPEPVLWLKADGIIGLGNGDSIATWPDKSGNGNHAGGAGGPAYVSAALNGKPAVRFDGANDYFSILHNSTIDVSSHTFFYVGKADSSSSQDRHQIISKIDSESSHFSLRYDILNQHPNPTNRGDFCSLAIGNAGHQIARTGGADHLDRFRIATARFNGSISGDVDALRLFCDGAQAAYSYNNLQGNGTDYRNSATLFIGVKGHGAIPADRYFKGDMAELILFDTALDYQQIRDVNAYLGAKYGIAVASGGDAAKGLSLVSGVPERAPDAHVD